MKTFKQYIKESTEADAEYQTAVDSGDKQTQQRLVDEAAKAAGYNIGPVYHGTTSEFSVFSASKVRFKEDGSTFFFTDSKGDAEVFAENEGSAAPKILSAHLSLRDPLELTAKNESPVQMWDYANGRIGDEARKSEHDGVIISATDRRDGSLFAAFEANQIKSAEPITRDDKGNEIPLNKRFDETTKDMRY
jgi:hypothetical protein